MPSRHPVRRAQHGWRISGGNRMPSPLGFETPDDRRADQAQLTVIHRQISPIVVHVLTEFSDASWGPDRYAVDAHPDELGWYLARPNAGPLDAPVMILLIMDDEIPTLIAHISGDVEKYRPRNTRLLPEILGRETQLPVAIELDHAPPQLWTHP
jgi:hypothetical protein